MRAAPKMARYATCEAYIYSENHCRIEVLYEIGPFFSGLLDLRFAAAGSAPAQAGCGRPPAPGAGEGWFQTPRPPRAISPARGVCSPNQNGASTKRRYLLNHTPEFNLGLIPASRASPAIHRRSSPAPGHSFGSSSTATRKCCSAPTFPRTRAGRCPGCSGRARSEAQPAAPLRSEPPPLRCGRAQSANWPHYSECLAHLALAATQLHIPAARRHDGPIGPVPCPDCTARNRCAGVWPRYLDKG